jgi:hypothetical protein
MTTNQPAKRFRLGSITVTIWPNADRQGRSFHTTTIHRSYRDPQGQWATTASLRAADLPVVRELTRQAQEWLLTQPSPATQAGVEPMNLTTHQEHRGSR